MRATKTREATVASYIAASPAPARAMLKELRAAVRAAAPRAEEKLSYGMPHYSLHGRLVYFAAFKHHVSLYVMGRGKKVYATEIRKYQTSLATLQFPIGTRVPVALVRKLVRFRVRENEQKATGQK